MSIFRCLSICGFVMSILRSESEYQSVSCSEDMADCVVNANKNVAAVMDGLHNHAIDSCGTLQAKFAHSHRSCKN